MYLFLIITTPLSLLLSKSLAPNDMVRVQAPALYVPCLAKKESKTEQNVPQDFRSQEEHPSIYLKHSKNKLFISAVIKKYNSVKDREIVYQNLSRK